MKKTIIIPILLIFSLNAICQGTNTVVKTNGASIDKTDSTIAAKLNTSDTSVMLDPYKQKLSSISKSAGSDSVMQTKDGVQSLAFRTKKVFNVLDYGAIGDMKSGSTDTITAFSTTFISSTASFTSADIGKTIRISGAGASGVDLVTTIAGYTNSTTITLANAASTSISNKSFTYGTDNTSYIQAAANAVPTSGGRVYFPYGSFLIAGSVNFPNPTIIEGEMNGTSVASNDSIGSHYNTTASIIEVTSNLPQVITLQSSGSVWKNLNLQGSYGNAVTSGIGLKINGSGVSLYNSTFSNFYTSVSQNYSSFWITDRCVFNAIGYGLSIQDNYNSDWGDYSITNCWFNGNSSSTPMVGIYIIGSGGAKIIGNKFNTNLSTCILVSITGSTYSTSDLQIVGNSLENYKRCGINVTASGGGHWNNITIGSNQIASYNNYTSCIILNSPTAANINRVTLTGNVMVGINDNDSGYVVKGINDIALSANTTSSFYKNWYIDNNSTNVGNNVFLKGYTVATLPSTAYKGEQAYVTDATTPSYLTTVVGGGSTYTPVFYNGTNWVCH